mgnify:CR=1 FL=1|jgi:hypothetical protein
MKDMTVKVYFNVTDLGAYGAIPGLKEAMQSELIRVYNIYADKTNSGITEQLNREFNRLNPNYFEKNSNREWYELTEYNQFMADGYQKLIVDDLNESNASQILDFYVDPEEVVFKGMLKVNHNIKIDFYMKEA